MKTKFDHAWLYLLKNEGGFVNDKKDRGGPTKYGVSLKFLKGLLNEEADINHDCQVSIQDIQVLDEEKAKGIYKKHFWGAAKCDQIKETQIAVKVFDMCVNFGVRRGIRLLQTAINKMYDKHILDVDGLIGPRTLEAVNVSEPKKLMRFIIQICLQTYENIVDRNAEQKRFLKGWLRRARRIPEIV